MSRVALGTLILLLVSSPAEAQPMSGTITVNSDGSGGFDDVGAAFDALETRGIDGPVVVEIAQGPTPYVSAESYLLIGVAGVSSANTITIRPAPGERPVLSGSGAQVLAGPTGTLAIGTSHTTVQGLDLTGGTQFGLLLFRDIDAVEHITVDGNRVHGVTDGNGIWVSFDIADVTITNNFVFDIRPGALPVTGDVAGGIAVLSPGANTIIEHNTVVIDDASALSSLIGEGGDAGVAISSLAYNLFVYGQVDVVPYTFNRLPTAADRNLFFARGTADAIDLADFTTATGLDANSIVADPMFSASLGIAGDHGLAEGSPAVDGAIGSTVTTDAEGTMRPQGTAPDIGAFEAPMAAPPVGVPGLQLRREGETNVLATGDVIDLGVFTSSAQSVTIEAINGGTAPVVITDIEIVSSNNAGRPSVSARELTVDAASMRSFDVLFDPDESSLDFSVEVRVTSDDPAALVTTFSVSGSREAPLESRELMMVDSETVFGFVGCEEWTLRSVGTGPVTFSGVEVRNDDMSAFTTRDVPGTRVLEPGDDLRFQVCFTDENTDGSLALATIVILSDADVPVEVDVNGRVSMDACSVSRVGNRTPIGSWAFVLALVWTLASRRRVAGRRWCRRSPGKRPSLPCTVWS